jgi:hypothetical protein
MSAVGEDVLDFGWIPAQFFAAPPRRVELCVVAMKK